MPNNLLTADVQFPDLPGKPLKEQVSIITNYLFMLLEQLRYTLANLGADNFNESELDGLQKTFTGPIQIQVTDMEGNISTITATVEGLATQVEDAEGNVSQLTQTVNSLGSRVTNVEGDFSQISQTVDGIQSDVVDLDGEFSSIKQDVDGLNITTSGGVTYISGSHVKSGTISGSTLECNLNSRYGEADGELRFYYRGTLVGRVQMDTNGNTDGTGSESRNRVFFEAMNGFVLKLLSEDNMSLTSTGGSIYVASQTGRVELQGETACRIRTPGGQNYYEFRDDGIYLRNVKITN